MNVLMINSKSVKLHYDGFLADPQDWDEDVALSLARKHSIELTGTHWRVIFYLRDYWLQFNIVPILRKLCREIGISQEDLTA